MVCVYLNSVFFFMYGSAKLPLLCLMESGSKIQEC